MKLNLFVEFRLPFFFKFDSPVSFRLSFLKHGVLLLIGSPLFLALNTRMYLKDIQQGDLSAKPCWRINTTSTSIYLGSEPQKNIKVLFISLIRLLDADCLRSTAINITYIHGRNKIKPYLLYQKIYQLCYLRYNQ